MAHIFISYSHADSDYAHRLAKALEKQGLVPWIDERIDYGTRWLHEIEAHIDDCSALIVIMTPRSKESDWVQSEWLYARDRKKPIYALLLDGEAWLAFHSTQYVDVRGGKLPPANFYTRLKAADIKIAPPVTEAPRETVSVAQGPITAPAARVTKASLSNIQTWGGIEFVLIPAGKFLMGSKHDDKLASDDQKPQHTVEIPYDYWIARYPVTNEQFAKFVRATQYVTTAEKEGGWSLTERKFVKGLDWRHAHAFEPKSTLKGKGEHPVVQVSWLDAMEYCKWLNTLAKGSQPSQGLVVRLPTEAEWEKAARGEAPRGNEWPWGNEFDPNKCNSSEGKKGGTTPVGAYSPQGDSPYGVADMAGNVWEWCHSLYQAYPYKKDDGREDSSASGVRVLRGGAYYGSQFVVRCAFRYNGHPVSRSFDVGFRVGVSPGLG